ncbi:hypothetical protein EDD16DRAFT_1224787 [Pisolithus croceorrhizus]|nr:hypothetical protein EDD16DRAFT_1224787 [Pisolithus croceorrhizus]KAI6127996.1 hypothetical protein EV401DRAFT_940736 [Pisolithus croceorrhizus]KAI6142294.1 hypothetical protein EDD17DRAFT_255075 [Pisolithus thermaeus]KAI6147640.1 hypothetical protein EDD17DRAFT_77538 [Pisolithus thermaeus]
MRVLIAQMTSLLLLSLKTRQITTHEPLVIDKRRTLFAHSKDTESGKRFKGGFLRLVSSSMQVVQRIRISITVGPGCQSFISDGFLENLASHETSKQPSPH